MHANPVQQASSGDLLADRRYAYAQALAAEGDHAAAVDLIRQTLDLVPNWAPAWFALGQAQAELFRLTQDENDRAQALRAFACGLSLDPEDRLGARLQVARLQGGDANAASSAYVTSLFDQ